VRNAKQVADLCEQLTRMSDLTSVAEVAAQARDAVLRSVVAGYSSVHPAPDFASSLVIPCTSTSPKSSLTPKSRPAPLLHQLRGSRFRPRQSARSREGALFARYSRSSKSLRRSSWTNSSATSISRATLLSTRPSDSTVPTSSIRGSLSSTRRLGGSAGWRAPRL